MHRHLQARSSSENGGRFPQIFDHFQDLKIGVPSDSRNLDSEILMIDDVTLWSKLESTWLVYLIFTARRVCLARTMPWQDVPLFVRPSVCHTPVFCQNGYTFKLFHYQTFHFFTYQTGWRYSDGDPPPNGGVECKEVLKKSRFSTNISLYLGNNAR